MYCINETMHYLYKMERVRRINIFDGEKTLTEEDFEKNSTLKELSDIMINREQIAPFIKRINKERGTLVINLDEDKKLLNIDLMDVSASLYFEFMNR